MAKIIGRSSITGDFELCSSNVFLISSVLLFESERKYIPTMKNKIKTLVIPYLFWNTVGVVIFIVLQSLSFTAPVFFGASTPILQSSAKEWLKLYGIGADCPKVYPLWFLRDLIFITALFPLNKNVSKLYSASNAFPGSYVGIVSRENTITGGDFLEFDRCMHCKARIEIGKIGQSFCNVEHNDICNFYGSDIIYSIGIFR